MESFNSKITDISKRDINVKNGNVFPVYVSIDGSKKSGIMRLLCTGKFVNGAIVFTSSEIINIEDSHGIDIDYDFTKFSGFHSKLVYGSQNSIGSYDYIIMLTNA